MLRRDEDAPVSHLLQHPGWNINQPVAFVPGVSFSSPLTLCCSSMWRTVYSFRCRAFLASCFHPLPPSLPHLLTATWTCLWACWLTRCTLNGTGLQGKREREGGGGVIVGDYSNLFLTSARSLGCVADHSLKPESCDESQLLTLPTSSYGIVVVHNGIKKNKKKHTVTISYASWENVSPSHMSVPG